MSTCTTLTLSRGDLTILKDVILSGGDTDDDNQIRINDVTLIGSNFGLTASSAPAMNPRADINADGQANVLDLSILGGSFGKHGCQPWSDDAPPDESSTATAS